MPRDPDRERRPFPRHRIMWALDGGHYPVLVANDCDWRTVTLELPPELVWQYVRHPLARGGIPCPKCPRLIDVPSMPEWMREVCLEDPEPEDCAAPFFASGMAGWN